MITEVIKNRRSVFPAQYNNEPISEEEIRTILEAANWAPTHRKTEPWRFKVFHSAEKRLALGVFLSEKYTETTLKPSTFKAKKIADKLSQSACVIAICMQRDLTESVPEWEEVAATAMAVQNMWLTAQNLNIGAYWSSPSLIKFFGEHVELAEGERCLGFFYMGKFNGTLSAGERKTNISSKTIWI